MVCAAGGRGTTNSSMSAMNSAVWCRPEKASSAALYSRNCSGAP